MFSCSPHVIVLKMLQPILQTLNSQRIILASGSPRRKQILENVGLKFEVVPSTFEENLDKSGFDHVYDFVTETAECKVKEVAQRLDSIQESADLLIGADTVVTMDNQIYEKPNSKDHAFEILSKFSGRCHTVYTGVVLLQRIHGAQSTSSFEHRYRMNKFHVSTEVQMTKMSDSIIRAYIDTGEPMDKAGGYGIQGLGGSLVEGIHGDYFNVMGFPLHRFASKLTELFGYNTEVDR